MQFQVPQFIETEDKIVGPLSIRQFIFIAAACGIGIMLYFALQLWLWIIIAVPILLLGISFAFVKVNGQPFSKIMANMMAFYWKPQSYLWQPEQPQLPKTTENMKSVVGPQLSIEKILAGLALKEVRQTVETRKEAPEQKQVMNEIRERFNIYEDIYGSRKAAKRIDYR